MSDLADRLLCSVLVSFFQQNYRHFTNPGNPRSVNIVMLKLMIMCCLLLIYVSKLIYQYNYMYAR